MEMTIEEHKEHLLDIMDSMPDDACGDWRDSLAYAIDIMRKYQKIEQIINNTDYIEEDVIRYKMICEVIEDGKID